MRCVFYIDVISGLTDIITDAAKNKQIGFIEFTDFCNRGRFPVKAYGFIFNCSFKTDVFGVGIGICGGYYGGFKF